MSSDPARRDITKLSRSDNVIKLLDSFNYGAYVEGIVFLIRLFSVAEFFQPFARRARRGRKPPRGVTTEAIIYAFPRVIISH